MFTRREFGRSVLVEDFEKWCGVVWVIKECGGLCVMHRRQVYYYYESLIMGWACQFRKWKKQGKGELRTATLQLAYYYNAFFVLY